MGQKLRKKNASYEGSVPEPIITHAAYRYFRCATNYMMYRLLNKLKFKIKSKLCKQKCMWRPWKHWWKRTSLMIRLIKTYLGFQLKSIGLSFLSVLEEMALCLKNNFITMLSDRSSQYGWLYVNSAINSIFAQGQWGAELVLYVGRKSFAEV